MGKIVLFPDEKIIKMANGDCWQAPDVYDQVPGKYTFTNQRIIFLGNGLIEKLRLNFQIQYKDIQLIEPYRVVFFSTGIRIYTKQGECYRLSLLKRKYYMELIHKYRNISEEV